MPHPKARIGVVADDLTGAADTAVGFIRSGFSALVTWADQEHAGTPMEVDVLAIDSGTRALGPPRAEATTLRIVGELRASRVRTLYKKVDSLLRGHVGVEVKAALTAWEPDAVAIVAPAFPATGRTTVRGQVLVEGVPLDRPSISRLLTDAGLAVARADLADVRSGALAATFSAHRGTGSQAIVCDAETDADLRSIAAAGADLGSCVVWVGSGGLAATLAATLSTGLSTGTTDGTALADLTGTGLPADLTGRALATTNPVLPAAWGGHVTPAASGPVLLVVGSTAVIARAQVDHLAAAGVAHVTIPVATLGSTHEPSGRQGVPGGSPVAEVMACLHAGHDVIVTLGADAGRPDATDDAGLTTGLGQLLRPCAPLVGGLVATGGDTATGVLRAWGTTALHLVGEVEPGVPLSRSIGPRPIPVVTKAGAFGRTGTLAAARARLEAVLTRAEGER
ncbi:four-carbon acid sugar kinase family protein [Actinopolymorpha sp. B11F2]|uniref:four-carbon acid sugar kinase family protein n=1 Tax=Actinopolymorpha sp. B11F2 TaxID=3160862 RepID=UPI0032E4EF25